MIHSFKEVNIINQSFNFFSVFSRDTFLVILKHEKFIFDSDGNIFLLVPRAQGFFVRFFSEVNKSIDEGNFDFFDRTFKVLEDEAV